MHVQVRHIQKRGNSFYFRLAIPAVVYAKTKRTMKTEPV